MADYESNVTCVRSSSITGGTNYESVILKLISLDFNQNIKASELTGDSLIMAPKSEIIGKAWAQINPSSY